MRRLVLVSCLALGACGTAGEPATFFAPAASPRTAGAMPDDFGGSASDAPSWLFPRGLRMPGPPRARAPSSERPDWLPALPETIERYPVPEDWGRDTLAEGQAAGAVFTSAPR